MPSQPSKRDLIGKARGFTDSIERMSQDERKFSPSGAFGEDYNRLRSAVAQVYPNLEILLPPEVEVDRSRTTGRLFTQQRYAEIGTFCKQICQLLDEQPDHPA